MLNCSGKRKSLSRFPYKIIPVPVNGFFTEPGNHFQPVGKIAELVEKNSPGFPVNYLFLDQENEKYYENERKLSSLINAATILSILISPTEPFCEYFCFARKNKVHPDPAICLIIIICSITFKPY